MLISICDVPKKQMIVDRVERAGGKIARINVGDQERYSLMDVQFENCSFTVNKVGTIKIETNNDVLLFFKEEHGNFYYQY